MSTVNKPMLDKRALRKAKTQELRMSGFVSKIQAIARMKIARSHVAKLRLAVDSERANPGSSKKESASPIDSIATWPNHFYDNFSKPLHSIGSWPVLSSSDQSGIQSWVKEHKKILIKLVTWNLEANTPPPIDQVRSCLIPENKFHIYVIGSEECENSIMMSALNPSKKNWELYLNDIIGSSYVPIRAQTLQAVHLMVFAHASIAPYVTDVNSAVVPTGK